MDSCCATDSNTNEGARCGHCGQTGPIVGHDPVRPHRPDATAGPWQHCATPDCPAVFYLDADTVTAAQLRTQVDHKALDKPCPVCFCFSHTADDIAADLQASDGVSTVKADIKTAVASGFCACEHLNPSRQCCLPDIHSTIKTITA